MCDLTVLPYATGQLAVEGRGTHYHHAVSTTKNEKEHATCTTQHALHKHDGYYLSLLDIFPVRSHQREDQCDRRSTSSKPETD